MAKTKEYFRFTRLVYNSWSVLHLLVLDETTQLGLEFRDLRPRLLFILALQLDLSPRVLPEECTVPSAPSPADGVGSARDVVSHPRYAIRDHKWYGPR